MRGASIGTWISIERETEEPTFQRRPSRMYDCRVFGNPLKMNPLEQKRYVPPACRMVYASSGAKVSPQTGSAADAGRAV